MAKKILVVEDELIVANDLQLILQQAGYSVSGIAASAEEADENIRQHKPDLVLLDIRLEGTLSGIDLARKLKADNIAFIYLSANSNQAILEEAKTTEPYGFLVKPFRKKDLLIMLDIAWYRHEHSLESKLRQEQQLQQNLAEISNDDSSAEQELLKIARVMQSHIPFDFIACGIRPLSSGQLTDTGYLRIGFEEYQFIGEKELMVITGLNRSSLSAVTENTNTDIKAGIYNHVTTHGHYMQKSLQETIMDHFQLASCLVFPVALEYGLSVHYFFYSRKPGIYLKDHIALLNRLKALLEDLAEKITYVGTSSIAKDQPISVRKRKDDLANSGFEGIIGSHHLLLSALDLVTQVAPYNTSVLILGESGTGKEKVAQSIHTLSPRKYGAFVKINCAAIPPTLIESELFGHEKGAFTGAIEKRKGKFEQADGGTIFLDEIGELPLAMQAKILRALQEKEIEYVGGGSPVKVNVRIVAATNRNLEEELAKGNFRLDLYYRLNVFPITLPPLRERKTDIEALAIFFAHKFCKEFNKPFNGIAASMMDEMLGYNWTGNIRELENVMEQSVILNNGNSKLELKRSLPAAANLVIAKGNETTLEDAKTIQRQTERACIISILQKTNGRIRGVNGAAELLKIKPTTLEFKIAKLNIKREDFKNAT